MLPAAVQATFVPGDPGRAARLALWAPPGSPLRYPGDEELELVLPTANGVRRRRVPVRLVEIRHLMDDLAGLPLDAAGTSASVHAWAVVTRAALGLVARGRIRPAVSPAGLDTWAVGPLDDEDRELRSALAAWLPPAAHCLPIPGRSPLALLSPEQAVAGFYEAIADEVPRTAAAGTVSRQRAWCGLQPVDVSGLRPYLAAADAADRTIVGLQLFLPDSDEHPFRVRLQVRSAWGPAGRGVARNPLTPSPLGEGRGEARNPLTPSPLGKGRGGGRNPLTPSPKGEGRGEGHPPRSQSPPSSPSRNPASSRPCPASSRRWSRNSATSPRSSPTRRPTRTARWT